MKKIVLVIGLMLGWVYNSQAEMYHGIDIDKTFETSDWNSKEDIRRTIDDYTSLRKYQEKLDSCPNGVPECFLCYDDVAKGIITKFYTNSEEFLTQYEGFRKALTDAYWQIHDHNKYWERGNETDLIDTMTAARTEVKKYVQSLLDFCKESTKIYASMMEDYKEDE